MKSGLLITLLCLGTCQGWGQDSASSAASDAPAKDTPAESWNFFYQATSVGQYHGTFFAPYSGPNSLANYPEKDVSLTTTLYFGLRLPGETQLYFDPEIAGGRGFTNVTGIANFTNGELPRVASAAPKPYIARLYLSHDFGFGDARESFESDANQLEGSRPMNRYTIVVGRFTLTDFFDNNRYTHDPRMQFLGWAFMYNGAWDYAADVRGYTWGWLHEYHARNWSVRYASVLEPRTANGPRFDRRVLVDRGDNYEGEMRYTVHSHPGAVRLLAYVNHTRGGDHGTALQLAAATGSTPNVYLTSKAGTRKYGFGINSEQEITRNIGVFARLGWNDGKTQDFAFTAIDRLASGGVSVNGSAWRRPNDVAATAFTASGISAVHALYLSRGGLDFIIGDGALNYAPEYIWESYYSVRLFPGFYVTVDAQHIANEAFNHDRGPLWATSLRLHLEGRVH